MCAQHHAKHFAMCCLRHAASAMKHPPCSIHHAASAVLPPPCSIHRPASAVQHPPCSIRRAASAVLPPPCSIRRAASTALPPPCSIRRAASDTIHPKPLYKYNNRGGNIQQVLTCGHQVYDKRPCVADIEISMCHQATYRQMFQADMLKFAVWTSGLVTSSFAGVEVNRLP